MTSATQHARPLRASHQSLWQWVSCSGLTVACLLCFLTQQLLQCSYSVDFKGPEGSMNKRRDIILTCRSPVADCSQGFFVTNGKCTKRIKDTVLLCRRWASCMTANNHWQFPLNHQVSLNKLVAKHDAVLVQNNMKRHYFRKQHCCADFFSPRSVTVCERCYWPKHLTQPFTASPIRHRRQWVDGRLSSAHTQLVQCCRQLDPDRKCNDDVPVGQTLPMHRNRMHTLVFRKKHETISRHYFGKQITRPTLERNLSRTKCSRPQTSLKSFLDVFVTKFRHYFLRFKDTAIFWLHAFICQSVYNSFFLNILYFSVKSRILSSLKIC